MNQKKCKAMRRLARLYTIGKPIELTTALYKRYKQKKRDAKSIQQVKATPIRTKSFYSPNQKTGEIPKASPPALQPYPRSIVRKGYKSDSYSHTKGFKKQSAWIRELFSTGFTPWAMGVL